MYASLELYRVRWGISEVREELCQHDNHDLSSTGKGRTTASYEITKFQKLHHRFTVHLTPNDVEKVENPAQAAIMPCLNVTWNILPPLYTRLKNSCPRWEKVEHTLSINSCSYASGFDLGYHEPAEF